MKKKKLCFIVTDAISFNVLCKGQFEYYLKNRDNYEISYVCGGNDIEIEKLKLRNIGNVHKFNFLRHPVLTHDILSLIKIIIFFTKNRFDIIVYSTPKALFLASIAKHS